MTELGYKILNCITWQKNNPPPNLSCRFFTHSTEFIIWARKSQKSKHYFNYELMKEINGGTQMRDVWIIFILIDIYNIYFRFIFFFRISKNTAKNTHSFPLRFMGQGKSLPTLN